MTNLGYVRLTTAMRYSSISFVDRLSGRILNPDQLPHLFNLDFIAGDKHMSQDTLTQEYLKSLLSYDPETGDFTRLVSSGKVKVGDIAGGFDTYGYRQISINNKKYKAHRLAFLWMEGSFPDDMVDHINHKPSDNRWINLRPATRAENQHNRQTNSKNTSGYKGIYFHKATGKYVAQVTVDRKTKYLGCFTDPEEAHKAYCQAANKFHGEFACTG